MSLFTDVQPGKTGAAIQEKIERKVEGIGRQATRRGIQAVNALRNAELEVLKGERSGRVYKKPGTYGKRASKKTRELMKDYGHKLGGGQLYRASAPGEAPARRTGNLRLHWNGKVIRERIPGGGLSITAELESQEPYAGVLEHGSHRMAPRPFVERIKQKATPKIKEIYSRPYT